MLTCKKFQNISIPPPPQEKIRNSWGERVDQKLKKVSEVFLKELDYNVLSHFLKIMVS